ncbi:hypothetical protein [Klebsiella pneumoniae]
MLWKNLKIKPQKTQISVQSLRTLNDFQKLLGDINWLWPSVGIPTYALQNLFKILEGSPDPNSPRQLTKEAKDELALVEKRIQQSFSTRLDYDQPVSLYIFPTTEPLEKPLPLGQDSYSGLELGNSLAQVLVML